MRAVILGNGPMGAALAGALEARGDSVEVLGRPPRNGHPASILGAADAVLDASVGPVVASNVAAAVAAGCRSIVIATSDWQDQRAAVADDLRRAGAAAVWAPNFSLGTALFARLVDSAMALYGQAGSFEPFIVEWHRRAKRDRPSGTARDLAARMGGGVDVASVRAGSSPGMHLIGFDAPGETVELRITARDRSAFAAGALAAVDWLRRTPRAPGLHPFDSVVDELVGAAHPGHGEGSPEVAWP